MSHFNHYPYISCDYAAHTHQDKKRCPTLNPALFVVLTGHHIASIVDCMSALIPSKKTGLTEDRHPADMVAGARSTGTTRCRPSLAHSYSSARMTKHTHHRPHPCSGQIIAGYTGIKPKNIWPHYDANGQPKPSRRHARKSGSCAHEKCSTAPTGDNAVMRGGYRPWQGDQEFIDVRPIRHTNARTTFGRPVSGAATLRAQY
ncbi:hypothetical protein MNBD_GAMMA20-2016 [hydrothermal vent metagenome]|uniref:Ner winged helix-turn-helix DNA-binding domain-containing protein n=1 Tax=hydrothermal vent metagenome TaxID=652676 RepID=A0A3B1AUU1_9ZZZZ